MNSYLLVADVLGFSRIVSNLDRAQLDLKINTWTSLVSKIREETSVKDLQLISDTIFVREDNSEDGLWRLLSFSKLLLEEGISQSFPIRGAITRGDVNWGSLIHGETVIQAHRLERSLDWIGIACSFLDKIPWSWDLVCSYPAPKKSGELEDFAVVSWNIPEITMLTDLWTSGGLFKDDKEIVLWESYSKFMHTVIFANYVSSARKKKLDPKEFHPQIPSHLNIAASGG